MDQPLTHDSASSATPRARKIELPWLILAALLLSTLLAAFQSSRQLRNDTEIRFNEIAQSEKRALVRQFSNVEKLLRSARAFEAVMPNPSQATWDTFVAAAMPNEPNVPPAVVAVQLVESASGRTGALETRTTWHARPTETDRVFKLSASPALLSAIANATAKNALVLSRPLDTPPDTHPAPVYLAMALPIGSDKSFRQSPVATLRQPAAVVAIIDLSAIVSGNAQNPAYTVLRELFDADKLLYPSHVAAVSKESSAEMTSDIPVAFGEQQLRLRISSTTQLEKTLRSDMPRAILIIGIFGTMLLGALVLLLTRLREQAESLAASMTRKLQDQTRFTEDLIEFNPNPIFRKDTEGRFVAVNQAWEQLIGRSRKDVLGKADNDLLPPGTAEQSANGDAQFLTSKTEYEASEVFVTNADGRQFETIVAKKILKRADGTVDGMIGTITDVTLIKNLERELARQRERLDLVIRSSQQGIWDIDLSEGGDSYFSDRFRDILGYTQLNFPTVFKWYDHVHPEDAIEVRTRVIEHFKGATALFDIECRLRRRDDNYLWVRVRAIAQRYAA